jgi:transcriptional regulator with XRE-family HTH domain
MKKNPTNIETLSHDKPDHGTKRIGTMLKLARKSKRMTQQDLADVVHKKRTYISRVENDGSNITLKTLYDLVEKGLGGKVDINFKIQ